MNNYLKLTALTLSAALLAACGGSSNNAPAASAPDAQFEVRFTNLTNAQPMSPVAVIMHSSGFNNFIDGEPASVAVEILAEGGNNAQVLSEAQAATATHIASASTTGPVPPRSSTNTPITLNVPAARLTDLRLSVMSMLVHTNDGFTGLNATDISGMAVGSSRSFVAPTWDAGTEADTELANTLPGPDFNGEGFNAARDDRINRVRFHNGAVTSASVEFGLATSALLDRHRFLNPTSRITVTRIQ